MLAKDQVSLRALRAVKSAIQLAKTSEGATGGDLTEAQELQILQKLVKTRRDAQTIYYSSTSESVIKILSTLESIYCAPAASKSAA